MLIVALEADGGGGSVSILSIAALIGVFYLLIIRPQRKKARQQAELADSLETGDEIRTIGGIHGTVVSIDDTSVLLSVEEGRLRVSRRAIGTRVKADE